MSNKNSDNIADRLSNSITRQEFIEGLSVDNQPLKLPSVQWQFEKLTNSIDRAMIRPQIFRSQKILDSDELQAIEYSTMPTTGLSFSTPALSSIIMWLKAFIPRSLPGITRPTPKWPKATMIDLPYIPGCYLTDNRDFSADLAASARMTSAVWINTSTLQMIQLHYCDYSVEVDCSSGRIKCQQQADAAAENMWFSNLRGIPGFNIEVDLVGRAADACSMIAGVVAPLTYNGTFAIDVPSRQVLFQGYVEPFPAFEVYAAEYIPNTSFIGNPLVLKRPTAGILSLLGSATEYVEGLTAL